MTQNDIFSQTVKCIVNDPHLWIDPKEVTVDSCLSSDFGMDLLDLSDLFLRLEESFDISLPATPPEHITVGDIVNYICELKGVPYRAKEKQQEKDSIVQKMRKYAIKNKYNLLNKLADFFMKLKQANIALKKQISKTK